jgi:nicotinamide-nucleotide amidase
MRAVLSIDDRGVDDIASAIADLALPLGVRVCTAESLTTGGIAAALGKAREASTWFAGGVVAYTDEAKFSALGVPRGRVVSERCAEQMARGAAELLQAEVAVAVTGAAGPEGAEGHPAGTVMLAVLGPDGAEVRTVQFAGEPADVVEQTIRVALSSVLDRLDGLSARTGRTR